ncbi:MAG: ABC transporter substrate-binding protein [Rhodospirillaceae bacterium]|nr:ABC transporter substrate-binding protein [Rhodospirillaceae bacterium]
MRSSVIILRAIVLAAAAVLAFTPAAHAVTRGKPVHGIALFGEPKYAADDHFAYVNPDAPRAGALTLSNEAFLTFDTFNAFTLKGAQAYGSDTLIHDTLMIGSLDEPASRYGLIAETIEVSPDGRTVQFVLRKEAKFSDGSPITAADVVFSYDTLITKARPVFRFIYADVEKAEAVDERTVRFTVKNTENSKVPLLLGEFPVFSQAYWSKRNFEDTTLDIPVVSGPYNVDIFEVGRYVRYKRLDNYWGKDLAILRGFYNFATVRYEYFRDDNVQFEAFKTGGYDMVRETSARRWVQDYNFPAFTDGRVQKLKVPSIQPRDVQTFSLNLRRPLFQDRRVREAINLTFDFESINKSLMYNEYVRLRSYWQGSALEAKATPAGAELTLLEPFRDKLPPELFTTEFAQPTTQGNGASRENLARAAKLLEAAGWKVRDGVLVNAKGQPFTFEITVVQPSLERLIGPWIQDMKRVGINATMRVVDTAQYANRVTDFDYDAILIGMATTLTPGAELVDELSSDSADRPGSSNYSGIKDPVIDALLQHIVKAQTEDEITAATRALDRVLTFNHYRMLTYTLEAERFAYWSKLKRPEILPALGLGRIGEAAIALWWSDGSAAAASPSVPTESYGGQRDKGAGTWVMIAVALGLAGAVIFVIARRRRA